MELPNEKYQIILADPPWKYTNSVYQDNNRKNRFLKDQYSSMNINEIMLAATEVFILYVATR